MDIRRPGSIVVIDVPLIDEGGALLSPTSVSYQVIDEGGNLIVAESSTSFTQGDASVSITVPAINNVLPVGSVRAMRVIRLSAALQDTTIVHVDYIYVIENESPLVVMVNSYQTLNQSKLTAMDLVGLDAWGEATDRLRKSAMIQAYNAIGKLRFDVRDTYELAGNGVRVSSRDSFVVDSAIDAESPQVSGSVVQSINQLTATQFAALPAMFRQAILRAQVVEADALLGGDPIAKKREEGLMSDSVGQSSIMFRPGKPIMLGVSRRTLEQLNGWVSFSLSVGR